MIEQGQALPSNLRIRMRPRPEAEERQVDLSRCPQRGELSRWCRRETEHVPLDPLPQTFVHERHRSQGAPLTASDQTRSEASSTAGTAVSSAVRERSPHDAPLLACPGLGGNQALSPQHLPGRGTRGAGEPQ